jgi:muramoyltetrapeptide carboxypeptidase
MNATVNLPPILLPAPLKKGDIVGLVHPAGPVQEEERYNAGIRLIREMGFEVKFQRQIHSSSPEYLAASDAERAREFNELWADPAVKALLAVRGGYGSLRMLDKVDMDLIRRFPKLFIGFSDVTVLLNVFRQETGLITYHGPSLTTLTRSDRMSVTLFFQALTGRLESILPFDRLEVLAKGQAHGIILGGNLTTLVHLVGTPYEINLDGSILVIEDVGEAPYRIDRMLTQLKLAGRLDGIRGLILGTFVSKFFGRDDNFDYEAVWSRALELVEELEIPVWADVPCGHGARNFTLPIGVEAEMDGEAGLLRLCSPICATTNP